VWMKHVIAALDLTFILVDITTYLSINEMTEKPLMKEFYICQQNILQKMVIFFLIEMIFTNINCLTASLLAPH
jgi:hypothetical protein